MHSSRSMAVFSNLPDWVRDARSGICRDSSDSSLRVIGESASSRQFRDGPITPASLSSRALEMPLRSWRVVRSGARNGGFWFQSQWRRVSSVRDGQFMLPRANDVMRGRCRTMEEQLWCVMHVCVYKSPPAFRISQEPWGTSGLRPGHSRLNISLRLQLLFLLLPLAGD